MNRIELKQKSKNQISGKLGVLFLCNFVVMIISVTLDRTMHFKEINIYISHNSYITINIYKLIISLLILSPIMLGLSGIYLSITRNTYPEVKDLFKYFKYYFKVIGLNLLVKLIIFAGIILFVIPGIILAFALSQTNYIFADNPEMGIMDIISTSMSMMKGHKWEYFVLVLSFLGWAILGMLLAGIPLIIYVIPYYMTTTANYYLALKNEYMDKMSSNAISSNTSSETTSNDTPWEIK